jgi:hypothetical protein
VFQHFSSDTNFILKRVTDCYVTGQQNERTDSIHKVFNNSADEK